MLNLEDTLKDIEREINNIHFATLDIRTESVVYIKREIQNNEEITQKIKSIIQALRDESDTLEWYIK